MQIATGVDLIEIERIQEAVDHYGDRFLERVYTATELVEARGSPASLAARFAAKEAVAKALGTGIGLLTWQEVEILSNSLRQPVLLLHGNAAQHAHELGFTHWSISLSHSQYYAIAVATAIGE